MMRSVRNAARWGAAAAGMAMALAATPSNAAQIKWEVQNAFFDDGTSLTGSFIFDTVLGAFSDLDLRTETGALSGVVYSGDPIEQFFGPPALVFDTASGATGIGEQGMILIFADLLFDPTKVVGIQEGLEGICVDADCADPPDPARALFSGGSVVAAAVPAPLGLPLLITGTAILGLAARRRRKAA